MSDFTKPLPEWNNPGIEPPQNKKDAGWQPNEKPPADYLNWMHHTTKEAIQETRDKIGDLSSLTTTEKGSLVGSVNEVSSQLADTVTKEITGDYINVMNPPVPYLPLQIDSSSYASANSTRLQSLLDNVEALNRKKLFFPEGTYHFSTGLIVKYQKTEFYGVYNDNSFRYGTELIFTGTGDFFTFGTPIAQVNFGDNLYTGLQYIKFQNLMLFHGAADTTLVNTSGSWENPNKYKLGSRGIVDWGGGNLTLNNVTIRNFEYGAYLVQSDFNNWNEAKFFYNKYGVYISTRSDQNIWIRSDFTTNDCGLWVDGALNLTLYSANFNTNGAGSPYGDVPHMKVTNGSVNLYAPWVETYSVRVDEKVPCFARVGMESGWNGVLTNSKMRIYDPLVTTGINNVVEFNKGEVTIVGSNDITTNSSINAIALKKGTEQGSFYYDFGNNIYALTKLLKYDAGATNAYSTGIMSQFNQMRFRGSRFYFDHISDTNYDFYLQATNSKKISLIVGGRAVINDMGTMTLERTSTPNSGTYTQGDFCRNTTPTEQGTTGSKYVVTGWICTVSGTPGTWVECRSLTGN